MKFHVTFTRRAYLSAEVEIEADSRQAAAAAAWKIHDSDAEMEWEEYDSDRAEVADVETAEVKAAQHRWIAVEEKNSDLILGLGKTAGAAMIDAQEAASDFSLNVNPYRCTAALWDRVREQGGAISWDIVRDVACTPEEKEAAQ